MDNQYIRGLRIQKKSVVKKLYAAVCMVLVAALLVSATSYAWLVLSRAPEVTGVSTTLGANGNLEIALNTNSLDTYIFTANEDTSIGIESVFDKNSYWGNVVDLSDERYGLQNIQLKPAALNYKSDAQMAVNMGAPFLIAQYGLDGRVTGLSSSGILTNFDSETNKFISSTNYGVRALGEASKALSTLTVDMDQDDAVLAVYNTYKAIADANSPEVSYQDWPAWREDVWNILLRIYFKHSDAIANGTTASESYTASTVDELETQYLVMQENIDKAYTYLQAMVICRVFADGSSLVAQAKIADLISNNEEDVREYFAAVGITDYNEALDLLDETKAACDGVLSAITSFKTTSAYTSGSISYDQIRNLLLSDLDLNNITFNGNSIGAYDIASYAADCYAYCLLNKPTTIDHLFGNPIYNSTNGAGLSFISALESLHKAGTYAYASRHDNITYQMTIPDYANNEELRGMVFQTVDTNDGHDLLSWAYPFLTDSTNKGKDTNTEFYKQAYADAKNALIETFYVAEFPDYTVFMTPTFDHILSVSKGESDIFSYEYLARLRNGLDALSNTFLDQYEDGIKYYALMFAALISDAEYEEGAIVTAPAEDSVYAVILKAIEDGKSADEVLELSGWFDYKESNGHTHDIEMFEEVIGIPYSYLTTTIGNAYAQLDALEVSKAQGVSLTWEEIYSVLVYIIGEDFAPYNGDQIEYANDRANCSIVLDVPSKAIGNIHTLFNNQNYACDFTLSELDISASSYDSFMERLIIEDVGILPEHMTYGVCIYRWDIPEYGEGNFELNANGTTYAFGIDLLFRTNATAANLLLQTIGIDRIYNNDNAPEDWMYSDEWEAAQGQGSRITMDNPDLLAALRVAFVDTSTGEIYGIAKADPNGYLYLSNDDGSATIKPLDQNVISAITVWIYLDGNIVENLHADTAAATDMKINLQFATDATLNPAFGGNSETPNGGNQTPSNPSDPTNPSNPDIVEPTLPTEQSDYYLEHDGNNTYSFYTLNSNGSREYELAFTGSMDSGNNTIVVEDITTYPANGVAIPAIATYTTDNEDYAVSIDPTAPFADLGTESAAIFFVPIEAKKVGITSANVSNLFSRNEGTDFVSLDLSGLDTSNVTSMYSMFYYCQSLKKLDVSGFDTSKVTNMGRMFKGCDNLTELNVSGFDTSNVTDMSEMFSYCYDLATLDVSGFNTSKVTDMGEMFGNCKSLTTLDVSGFDTSKVVDMSGMFYLCTRLRTLDVSGFDTSSATTTTAMFCCCYELTELDVSNFDTSNVTAMGNMFAGCSVLTELDVSGFDTSKVTSTLGMFSECYNLTELNVGGFDTSKVTKMNAMFRNCSKLATLNMSGWNISKVENADEFFKNCSNLQIIVVPSSIGDTAITLPGSYLCEANGNTYTVIDSTVPARTTLKKASEVTADDGNVYYFAEGISAGSYEIYTLKADNAKDYQLPVTATLSESTKTLTITSVNGYPVGGVIIPAVVTTDGETEYSVVLKAYDKPFYSLNTTDASITFVSVNNQFVGLNGTSLRNLFVTDSSTTLAVLDIAALDTSGVTTMNGAFYECSSLVSLNISGWDTSSVTDMSTMFYNCGCLTEVDVSGFDTSKVTDMSFMFRGCNGLKTLDVSGFDTSNVTNMASMFSAASSALTELDVSRFDTAKVTDMGGMFHGCSNLTTLDVSGFDTSNVTDMNWMFYNCSGLTELDVTNFDTSNVVEMYHMFSGCSGLTEIDVTGFNTSKATNICYMFMNCSGLTSLDVSNFDTSSVTNMGSMFRECSGLTELDLGGFNTSNVTDMSYMFYNCTKLTDLNLSGWNMSNVTNTTNMFHNCPAGSTYAN